LNPVGHVGRLSLSVSPRQPRSTSPSTAVGRQSFFAAPSSFLRSRKVSPAAAVVGKNGGKVLGHVRHPFPATDFSSFLLQAQASKAKIIGLANAGADTINSIKQASEFVIVRSG
jgi:hypothetical protein